MMRKFNSRLQSLVHRLPFIVLLALHQLIGTVGVIITSGLLVMRYWDRFTPSSRRSGAYAQAGFSLRSRGFPFKC